MFDRTPAQAAAFPSQRPATAGRHGFGLRGKLFSAFMLLVVLAALLGASAHLSLQRIANTLEQVSADSLPTLVHSLRLAERTQTIVADTASLITAADQTARAAIHDRLRQEEDQIRGIAAVLAARPDTAAAMGRVLTQVDTLRRDLDEIDALTETRIRVDAVITGRLRELAAMQQTFLTRLTPKVKQTKDAIAMEVVMADADNIEETLTKITEQQVGMMETLLTLLAEGNNLFGILAQIPFAPSLEFLDEADKRMRNSSAMAQYLLKTAESRQEAMPDVAKVLDAMVGFGRGDDNLFAVRRAALNNAEAVRLAQQRNAGTAHEFTEIVAAITDSVQRATDSMTDVSHAVVDRAVVVNGGIVLAIGVISILIAVLYIGPQLVDHLIGLNVAMAQLAEGNLDVAVPDLGRRDEIGAMARAVGIFKQNAVERANLQEEQIRSEQAHAEQRQAAMHRLVDSFEQDVRGIVEAVSSSSTELHAQAKGLSSATELVAARFTVVSEAAKAASSNVQTAAAAAGTLSSTIIEVGQRVAQSTEIAGQATRKAQHTNEVIQSLAVSTRRIGEVVHLINEIASQTNLLALNATIEAARAGEVGRGFAIVASEVKLLANRTAKATDDIADMIGAIQEGTEGAVLAIEDIGQIIGDIARSTQIVSETVLRQNVATQEISHNVQEAAGGASAVMQTIVDIQQFTDETGHNATNVYHAAQHLSEQSSMLSKQAHTFIDKVRSA